MGKQRIRAPPKGFLEFMLFSILFTIYVVYVLALFLRQKAGDADSEANQVQYDGEFQLRRILRTGAVSLLGVFSSIGFLVGTLTLVNAIYVNNFVRSPETPALSTINAILLLTVSLCIILLLIRVSDFDSPDNSRFQFM